MGFYPYVHFFQKGIPYVCEISVQKGIVPLHNVCWDFHPRIE